VHVRFILGGAWPEQPPTTALSFAAATSVGSLSKIPQSCFTWLANAP
jgi:hypothetical protein